MNIWTHIEAQITNNTHQPFQISNNDAMGGGCINTSCRISDGGRHYFVKVNHARFANMFEAEAEGLKEMAASNTITVPAPVCYGTIENQCYVVMEYLDLAGRANAIELAPKVPTTNTAIKDAVNSTLLFIPFTCGFETSVLI